MRRWIPYLSALALLLAAIPAPAREWAGLPGLEKRHGSDDDDDDDRGGRGGNSGSGNSGGSGSGGNGNGNARNVIKFDQGDFPVTEAGGVALVSVERSRGERGTVSVSFRTEGGTATPGADYQPVSGTLTWAAGDGSRKVIRVPILADNVSDHNETIRLVLSNPTGGANLHPQRSTALVRILETGRPAGNNNGGNNNGGEDGSRPGTIKFSERGFQVNEGAGVARVAVERSRGERGTVSIRWTAAAGSARAGDDFDAASGILTWGPGDGRNQLIEIPIHDDAADEGNETIRLTLSQPAGGAIVDGRRGTATLTILDNDGSAKACVQNGSTLCLAEGRFRVDVVWRSREGRAGKARAAALTDDAGTFVLSPGNELVVGVADACGAAGAFEVLLSGADDADFTVTVTDTRTGLVKQYANPAGLPAEPVRDAATFRACGS